MGDVLPVPIKIGSEARETMFAQPMQLTLLINTVISGIGLIYTVVTTLCWLKLRHIDDIAKRDVYLTTCSIACSLVMSILGCITFITETSWGLALAFSVLFILSLLYAVQ